MSSALAKESRALTAEDLTKAFKYATDWLGVFVEEVNALNVYPVPDGDTGTNMHLTMQSVRRQLAEENPTTMTDFAHALSYGSLLGARGNSGVILSQVLKGFAETIKQYKTLTASELIKAFHSAAKAAYAAVIKPVEGTILTVVRSAAEGIKERMSESPIQVLKSAWVAGQEALKKTPDMLPLLKQAGVVDAGGLGFLRVLEGIIAFFEGKDLPPPPKIEKRAQETIEEQEFGYCTEFLLSNVKVDTKVIQEAVQSFGDSLLVVGAEGFVKGHIHTEEPEKLLALVAQYGKMVKTKVEDMTEQHSEILQGELTEADTANVGLVVVSDGYGITKVFRSLKARVVGGGQTNNPSVQDIADAVRSVGAHNVIVLPNNKNIIMAAERVNELVKDKEVKVLPTRTMGQGLAAAILFQETAEPDELLEEMQEAADNARTLEVTTASRSATIDGVEVNEGQFIGLLDTRLKVAKDDPEASLKAMLEPLAKDYEVATLFYSSDVGEERAEALLAELSESYDDMEIELLPGAPALYPYLMVLE
ncbi:MAG: DAK2 domain-containing protein [Trueperaceae bacterium]|nr:DAK2 domain-containing protein [Trueperaceae bacterium]